MMKNLFEQSRSHWVRYDHYELKTAEDGKRYITPGKSAKPDVYNPLKEVPGIVLDALNVGMLMMGRKPEAEVEKAVMEFITRYGLLGLMTALPTTPSFMDYEAVYLPKNHFIKEESMATDQYLSLFYPFDQLDLVSEEHKEVLYFLSLRLYSSTRLAAVRGQSDRNIRKLRKTIHKKLQRQMYDHLCGKPEHSLTLRERQFLEEYSKIARKQGKDAVIRRENKTKRRKKKNRP